MITCKEDRISQSGHNAIFSPSRGRSIRWLHPDVHARDCTTLRCHLARDPWEAALIPAVHRRVHQGSDSACRSHRLAIDLPQDPENALRGGELKTARSVELIRDRFTIDLIRPGGGCLAVDGVEAEALRFRSESTGSCGCLNSRWGHPGSMTCSGSGEQLPPPGSLGSSRWHCRSRYRAASRATLGLLRGAAWTRVAT